MSTWITKALAKSAIFGGLLGGPAWGQKTAAEHVAGRLTDATDGRPLGHATLTLQDTTTDAIVATTASAEDGSFRFDAITPGHYRLKGRARGFAPALYLQHGIYSSAIVTGAGLDTGHLNLQLRPAASISGRVLDEAGEPIPLRGEFMISGATVTLYCEDPSYTIQPVHACGNRRTGNDGSFEFAELEPGRYYLTASARPWYEVHPPIPHNGDTTTYRSAVDPALDVTYPLIFYPHALSSDQAEPLVLQAGDQVTANMQMQPERALTIAVPHSSARGSSWTFPTVFREVFGTPEILTPLMDSSETTGYLMGLPQGQYTLLETSRESPLAVSTRTVDLGQQSVTLEPGNQLGSTTVTLRMHQQDGSPMPKGTEVRLQDSGPLSAISRTDDKGVAEFPKVPEGSFPVSSEAGEVLRLSVNGSSAPGFLLRVTAGEPVTADVTLGPPIQVQGTVRTRGKLDVGAMVVLVPAGSDTAPELFRRDQSDLDGGFTFAAVPPGRYLVIALDDGWALHWTDTHVLEPYLLHALPLVVPLSAHGTVHLGQSLTAQAAR